MNSTSGGAQEVNPSPSSAQPGTEPRAASGLRRFSEVTVAVAIWMAIGLALHLSANAYLLAGVPITVAFQRYVRHAPLRAMWVQDAPAFRLGPAGVAGAVLLMILPSIDLAYAIRSHLGLSDTGWMGGGDGRRISRGLRAEQFQA